MKRTMRSIAVITGMLLIPTIALAGCSSSPSTSSTTTGAAAAPTTTAAAAPTTTQAAAPTTSAAAPSDKQSYHFEIVSKGFQSTYWQAVYKGSQQELAKLNTDAGFEKYTMNFVGPDSESDIAVQVQQLTSALNAKPASIGLAALDVNALLDTIKSAQGAGIPIIGFDSGVPAAPAGSVLANASTDNLAAGGIAADGLYDKIKGLIGQGKQVRIGVVNQDATSESITNRGIGFINEMLKKLTGDGYTAFVTGNDKYVGSSDKSTGTQADANVIIEVRVPAQTTTELCATEAGAILNEKDTIAIFGSNQVAAEGVITANGTLNVLGTDPGQIVAVGFDSGSVIKAAVTAGTMYGAVTQAPVQIGVVLIDLLAAAAQGQPVKDTDTGAQFYTAANIGDPNISQNLYD